MKIAVLVPCLNEEETVAAVVTGFRAALPDADIYVYDNNSTDRTAEIAREAGAIVRAETRPGKGAVVRRMFADIDADIYVMADGDATYEAAAAPRLVQTLVDGHLDFVNGSRVSGEKLAYPPGHRFGNWALTGMVRLIFGDRFRDMLSGYKVFSRRYVKSFPAHSSGFEIETELTVHALELGMAVAEVSTAYAERPAGSESKLRTFRDGYRIIMLIFALVRYERPLPFFGFLGLAAVIIGIGLSVPLLLTFFETGLVPRLPTAVLSVALVISGLLGIAVGLVLDTVTTSRREMKRLFYLNIRKD